MKINTLLLLLLVGMAGYGLLSQNAFKLPNSAADATPTPAPGVPASPTASSTTRSTPARTVWKKSELMVVHGRIIKESAGGVTVVCEPFDDGGLAHSGNRGYTVRDGYVLPGASLSAGEQKRLVEDAIATDRSHYGPLMMLWKGNWEKASANGAQSASGTVSIVGALPRPQGARRDAINVVVAPLGDPASRVSQGAFTTQFQLEEDKQGAWLWRSTGNPLNKRAY